MNHSAKSITTLLSQEKLVVGCLLLLSAVATAFALSYMRTLMIPFILAVFLVYIISPAVDFLQIKLKLPRWVAITFTLVGTILFLMMITLFVTNNFRALLDSASTYKARIITLTNAGIAILDHFGYKVDSHTILNTIRDLPIFSILKTAAGGLVNLFSNCLLVLIFLLFLISGSKPGEKRKGIYGEIDKKIRRYIVTKLGTSASTGILVGLTFTIFGVDLAFMFGVLTFLLNFIPTLGSIIAVLLPIPIILLQFSNPAIIIACIVIPSTIQFSIGNVVEPKLLGQSLDLHPAALLLALMFWGMIWGPVGMLLATPIMAILKIAMSRIEATKPMAELLAGRLPA